MKPKIAIVGSGISGLSCLYFLHKHYDITLFEANEYIGGHTNTVQVKEDQQDVPIDTGFMVYNNHTYPNLIKLFDELDINSYDTSMSFGVQDRQNHIEMAFSNLNTLFAQRQNLLKPKFYKLILDIKRFFAEANEYLETNQNDYPTLSDFITAKSYSKELINSFLLPMISAIWSTPSASMLQYPTLSLFEFMKNHGLLGIGTQFTWKTVLGGSSSYKDKILKLAKPKIHLGEKVCGVEKNGNQVVLYTKSGTKKAFSKVILASHANQSLNILNYPTPEQKRLLSPFQYNVNCAILHKDTSVMPKAKDAWASWNYRSELCDNRTTGSTHYWMNNLQKLSTTNNYFVSIDYPEEQLDPESIVWKRTYEHPRFNTSTLAAQRELQSLNNNGTLYFCGSYFGHGFHEDGLKAGIEVCKKILNKNDIWT